MGSLNEEKNRNSQLWPIIKGLLALLLIVLIVACGNELHSYGSLGGLHET